MKRSEYIVSSFWVLITIFAIILFTTAIIQDIVVNQFDYSKDNANCSYYLFGTSVYVLITLILFCALKIYTTYLLRTFYSRTRALFLPFVLSIFIIIKNEQIISKKYYLIFIF